MSKILKTHQMYGEYSHVPGHEYRDIALRKCGKVYRITQHWGTDQGGRLWAESQDATIAEGRTMPQLRANALAYASDWPEMAAAIRIICAA